MGFSPARERLALEHLETALSWPEAERDVRLSRELRDDPELLQSVRELLATAAHGELALPTQLPMAPPVEDAPPPERIGPYRITGLLGSGGMGRVFRASRVDGLFDHEVAIKLTRRSHMSQHVAEQFARERQILARLQHRNIAQLFDGGVTPEGESWFVMELVSGLVVTDYVREHQLSLKDRLQLFRQIAGAVQYAHAQLVVHADIKPANIVVTHDGTAKLLDFGVSRALATVAEESLQGPMGLTFKYASPARRAGGIAGTADDIFSLGVLLEELVRPCGRLAPDLESILRMAAAPDASDRYATVEALQKDLQRWLAGHPVSAHPGSWGYYARRLMGRHKLTTVVASAAMLLLAGAAVALGILYVRAEHARVDALDARARAERRFNEVHTLSRYMLFDMYDRLDNVPRALTLRRDLAEAAQRYLDGLSKDPDAPAAVKLDVIEGLRRLAQVQATPGGASLAMVPQARRNLELAERMAESLVPAGATPGAPAQAQVLARVLLAQARISLNVDLDAARALQSLDRIDSLLAAESASTPTDERQTLRTEAVMLRADALEWQGKYKEATALVTAELARSRSPEAQWTRDQVLEVARLQDLLAESIYYGGDTRAAEAPYRRQLALLQDLLKKLPDDIHVDQLTQRAAWSLGSTLMQNGRFAAAEPVLARAQLAMEELHRLDPQDASIARLQQVVLMAHAQSLVGVKRFDEAIPVLKQGVALRLAASTAAPEDYGIARDYAVALNMLGDALGEAGRRREACTQLDLAQQVAGRLKVSGKLAQLDIDYMQRLAAASIKRYCGRSAS